MALLKEGNQGKLDHQNQQQLKIKKIQLQFKNKENIMKSKLLWLREQTFGGEWYQLTFLKRRTLREEGTCHSDMQNLIWRIDFSRNSEAFVEYNATCAGSWPLKVTHTQREMKDCYPRVQNPISLTFPGREEGLRNTVLHVSQPCQPFTIFSIVNNFFRHLHLYYSLLSSSVAWKRHS